MSENADPAGATIGILRLKASRISKKFITVSWKPVAGANRYIVYGARCGKKYAKLAIVPGTSYKHTGLLKGKYYKYVVIALAPDGHVVAASKSIHVATKGGKVGNFTKVTVNKKKIALKKGKTFKLKAKLVKEPNKKVQTHCKARYESSNKAVAAVTKTGIIQARSKGSCVIYVYAQNGVLATVKVQVN